MKLKLSSHSPFVGNIFGVGGFFIFLCTYIFLLSPFFYIINYLVFSHNGNKLSENGRETVEFVVMPDGEIKDFMLQQSNCLKNIQLNDLEYAADSAIFPFEEKKTQLFILLEYVKDISFSDLVNTKQYLKIYYQSYTFFLDKKDNSLHLKDNFVIVHDFSGKSFDNNSIDSIKMKMDKINYDLQLESERWYGRFIQKNRAVISEIVKFINSSNLPEILKNDVISISENNSLILDYEDYLKELIVTLENAEIGLHRNLYQDELSFLRKKYAEMYKIKSENEINGTKLSVYDFFKIDNMFISDNLKLVIDKKVLVQENFLSDFLSANDIEIKRIGNYFLMMNENRKLKLINNSGELLKESKNFLEIRLFGSIILCFIFLTSFLNRKTFISLQIFVFIFIIFFGKCFFAESILMIIYSIFLRRIKLK